ncbi:MAG: hypothetical protein IT530_17010 [Burkholderiales bacterium]|nr:hypothetical protein [Burkholderiales bacterium]
MGAAASIIVATGHCFGCMPYGQRGDCSTQTARCFCQKNRAIFLTKMYLQRMGKHVKSIDSRILARILAGGPGQVFAPGQFLDLGSRDAVDQALSRQCRAGTIRKVARGLYDLPRDHARFGRLAPSADAIAEAIKGRDAIRLQPSGAHAANVLGLSDQVPVRLVFLTDGRSRRVKIDGREIVLKQTTPRNIAAAGRTSGLVIQALRWLGKENVDDRVIAKLERILKPEDKATLLEDAHLAPAWIATIFHRLVGAAQ